MQSRELDGIRLEHSDLMQKYSDALTLLKDKEVQMRSVEQSAHEKLSQAQKDAEECIAYFKGLALQAKGKGTTVEEVVPSHFPRSLKPSSPTEN